MAEKILMYMHAGSGNHGCEAIVNSVCHLLNDQKNIYEITVLSNDKDEDERYSLKGLCRLVQEQKMEDHFFVHIWCYLYRKLTGNIECFPAFRYKKAGDVGAYRAAVSIGGDNYCYDSMVKDLAAANSMFHKRGIKTILLGCSIEPELLKSSAIITDMKKYERIISRESITTKALLDAGIEQVTQLPDPAFSLKPEYRTLPERFLEGNTVGINVSPMVMDFENQEQSGIVWKNYIKLLEYILKETKMRIALIPHVIWDRNNDRVPIRRLKEHFQSDRITIVEDGTCGELKGDIARCRFFVGARTHATIAAYSSCVPTLVAGYSVKSLGIAKDLFGTSESYVVDVRTMRDETELTQAFCKIVEREDEIRRILAKRIPEYQKQLEAMKQILLKE